MAAATRSRGTNLGPIFGLLAAAALLIDYVITVAISTAVAIAQFHSVNQSAKRLRTALLGRPRAVVVAVPYRREDEI